VSSRRSFYFASILLAAICWSSSILYMNAAAADFAYSLNLTNAIAQNYSSGYGYGNGQNSGAQDLLPPSLGGGAKVHPTVTPPSASDDSGQGYGRGNGGNGNYRGQGGYGSQGYGRNNMNSGYGGHHHHHHNRGMGYSSNMGGGGQGSSYGRWNNSGGSNSSQSSGGPVITNWNTPKSGASSSHSALGSSIHTASTSSAASKERAIHDAADHLAAHYDVSGNSSVPRLGATKNDLHVQNYEINDTASGAEVPLVATPKSLY
jgi:hypothetical protein